MPRAKAHAGNLLQIVQRGDLAGGMAHQGQRQFIFGDAFAIVAYTQQLDAAAFQLYINLSRVGIQTVFQQFLRADAGRSITSPAAIWLMRSSGSRRMADMDKVTYKLTIIISDMCECQLLKRTNSRIFCRYSRLKAGKLLLT